MSQQLKQFTEQKWKICRIEVKFCSISQMNHIEWKISSFSQKISTVKCKKYPDRDYCWSSALTKKMDKIMRDGEIPITHKEETTLTSILCSQSFFKNVERECRERNCTRERRRSLKQTTIDTQTPNDLTTATIKSCFTTAKKIYTKT